MALEKKTSFNQAWKDFLLVRPFTRSSQIIISRNPEKIVVGVQAGEFKLQVKGTEQYMIDDVSCSGIILAYPKKIVEDAIREKIFEKLIGKPLSDEKMESIKNKLDWDAKKTASRLGCSNSNEIQQAISERNFWQVSVFRGLYIGIITLTVGSIGLGCSTKSLLTGTLFQ